MARRGGYARPSAVQRRKSRGTTAAASSDRCWRFLGGGTPGRLSGWACQATVEEGVSLVFHHRPQLTHDRITFRTRNSRQDLQKAVDALLAKEATERVQNVSSLGFYSQLFLVLKKTGDLCPIIDLSTLNRHLVVPHFWMEIQSSIRAAIKDEEWTVSIDIKDTFLHIPMHGPWRNSCISRPSGRPTNFNCLPFRLATSPREFTKLLRPVIALLWQLRVKLLLRPLADPSELSRSGPTECQDDYLSSATSQLGHQLREVRPGAQPGLSVYRHAVQHVTVHCGAPAKNETQATVSSSPAGSTSRLLINGSDSLHRCVQFRLGSPVRVTLDTGTVVSFSKIISHQCSRDAVRAFLPHLRSRVVRLMCNNAVAVAYIKNEGSIWSYTLMQLTPAEVVLSCVCLRYEGLKTRLIFTLLYYRWTKLQICLIIISHSHTA